jgi:DNA-binding transcriptional ArsR family regulator
MSNYSTDELRRMADTFKALSNPNRLRIFLNLTSCCAPGTVRQLDDADTACVGDLSRDLQIVPSTVSHHIKELRRAGLIRMERKGQKIECWIDAEAVAALGRFFGGGTNQ